MTNDTEIEQRIRSLRFYGIEKEGRFSRLGYNSRLDEIQCAVLRVKLNHLSKWTQQRIRMAEEYHKRLSGLPLTLPILPPGMRHVYHLFVIRTPERDALKAFLSDRGVETKIHYPVPIHLQDSMRFLGCQRGDFPMCEQAAREMLSLPIYPELSIDQFDQICNSIHDFFHSK